MTVLPPCDDGADPILITILMGGLSLMVLIICVSVIVNTIISRKR